MHPQKPNFIRMRVGLGQDGCVSACFWSLSGRAPLCWVGHGERGGQMASCLIQLEVQSCTAAGSLATAKPGLMSTVPQAECSHSDGSRKQSPPVRRCSRARPCHIFKRVADAGRICCFNLKRIHDKEINEDVPDICTSFMSQLEASLLIRLKWSAFRRFQWAPASNLPSTCA